MINAKFNSVQTVLVNAGFTINHSDLLINLVLECVDSSEENAAAVAFETLASLDWTYDQSPEFVTAVNGLFGNQELLDLVVAALAAAL